MGVDITAYRQRIGLFLGGHFTKSRNATEYLQCIFKVDLRKLLVTAAILLLLSGDVESNPGPKNNIVHGMKCAAFNCGNTWKTRRELSFFRFPKDR
jgi:hypothetical protein